MDRTEYTIKLVKIWNTSDTSREAFDRASKALDENLTYSKMMNKINHIRYHQGINLRAMILPKPTDWAAVKKAAEH